MKIQISQVNETASGLIVIFETQIGIGKGIWSGARPLLQTDYVVELTVRDSLVWGETIVQIQDNVPKISFIGNTLSIDGQLNHIYSDGVIVIALDTSSTMVQTTGIPPQLNDYIRIVCDIPIIYDTRI